MDLVTITDHDSTDGLHRIQNHPNAYISAEVTCHMPTGTQIHVGVYDITERQHIQIQGRRNDLVSLLMYLSKHRIFFSLNHLFSSLTGPRTQEDFDWFRDYFPAFETRNGQMLTRLNRRAEHLARRWQKIGVGGSDAHTLAWAGTTYTEVCGARNKEEFLSGPRSGNGYLRGAKGSYGSLASDLLRISGHAFQENPWMGAFVPILLYSCQR